MFQGQNDYSTHVLYVAAPNPPPTQTSKPAVPQATSNAGETIKRQKLFSVRPWFIWLKNETTNPTDIISPSQGHALPGTV